MARRVTIAQERMKREIGLSEEDIKLLYSLSPENFTYFRDQFNAQVANEQKILIFYGRP
ncbi:MAG: hypothetical protein PVF58_11230 [Candidatus Methanofastidiosia archaeon]